MELSTEEKMTVNFSVKLFFLSNSKKEKSFFAILSKILLQV